VQVFDEDVHKDRITAEIHELNAEIERQLFMEPVARAIFERPILLHKETDAKSDQEREHRREEVIDMREVSKRIEHHEIDQYDERSRDEEFAKLLVAPEKPYGKKIIHELQCSKKMPPAEQLLCQRARS
jgi:hypothetical protein